MKDKRVLIISPEVVPYLPQSEQAINSFNFLKEFKKEVEKFELLCQDTVLLMKDVINFTKS